jgi:hypothetical protein
MDFRLRACQDRDFEFVRELYFEGKNVNLALCETDTPVSRRTHLALRA